MTRALPPLTALRAFEAFARAGSMTRAAQDLAITHGAVSRQVRALELRMGVRLVVGPRRDLRLTEAGQRLAAALSSAFDMIAAALPGAALDRELVVSCYGTFAMKWLIPRLPGFLDQQPGLRVRILESYAPVDFGLGYQAAIRSIEGRPAGDWRYTAFMPNHVGLVMSAELLAEQGGDLQRVLALPRLHCASFLAGWSEWGRQAGIALPPSPMDREFEHNSHMLEAAAAGLGVGVTTWSFAEPEVLRGRLAAPFGFVTIPARYLYLRPRLAENPAAEAFGLWLRAEGARAPPPPGLTLPKAGRVDTGMGAA